MSSHRLDPIDRKILAELQQDGRMTNVELARRVGISAPPCLRRVRTLEEQGFIRGYHAEVDSRALGFEVQVFASVGLQSQAEADLRRALTKPAFIGDLLDRLQRSPNAQVRQLAAVLMRRKVGGHWSKLPPPVQAHATGPLWSSMPPTLGAPNNAPPPQMPYLGRSQSAPTERVAIECCSPPLQPKELSTTFQAMPLDNAALDCDAVDGSPTTSSMWGRSALGGFSFFGAASVLVLRSAAVRRVVLRSVVVNRSAVALPIFVLCMAAMEPVTLRRCVRARA